LSKPRLFNRYIDAMLFQIRISRTVLAVQIRHFAHPSESNFCQFPSNNQKFDVLDYQYDWADG
jgi:hypothetical protein